MGTNTQKNFQSGKSNRSQEQKELLAKARAKVELANKWRMAFLVIALLFLLFLFFGGKLFEGASWFAGARQIVYWITGWDLLAVLAATLVQFYLTYRYNHLLKSMD